MCIKFEAWRAIGLYAQNKFWIGVLSKIIMKEVEYQKSFKYWNARFHPMKPIVSSYGTQSFSALNSADTRI